jgi:periplasmic copper chaperone A
MGRGRSRALIACTVLAAGAAGCGERPEAHGQRLYAERGCAVCHGRDGAGDGPSAPRLNVTPRDFADTGAFHFGVSRDEIASSIRNGAGAMPPFRDISESEAHDLAAWIATRDRGVAVREAWVRASTATRTVSSAYFTFENRSDRAIALTGVAAEGVGRAETHATVDRDGQAAMTRVASLPIPAGGSVTLAPGGTHVMITDITQPLEAGGRIRLTLTFDDHHRRTVTAAVRPLDAVSAR